MPDFTVKQGDTLPVFSDTLSYSDGTNPNLTGASVQFIMRSMVNKTVTTNAAATIVSPTAGTVSYTPTATDTATAGQYEGVWLVTFAGGAQQSWPTDGYLDIWIEPNLTSDTNQYLLSLPDMKDHLNIQASNRANDQKLIRWVMAATSVIEHYTGPLVPKTYDEWYDGGQYEIRFRHRPVLTLVAASMYLGPVEYAMAQVTEPQDGSIFSVMVDGARRLVRRGPGGSQLPFPGGLQSVHIVYTAGYTTVPENIRQGALEMLRENWVSSQTPGGPRTGAEALMGPDSELGHGPIPVVMSDNVRQWLAPQRRHPVIC